MTRYKPESASEHLPTRIPHQQIKEQNIAGTDAGTCYNPSTSRGPGVQGQPWLHREFEASLGYVRVCLKRAKTKVKNHQIQHMLLTKHSETWK